MKVLTEPVDETHLSTHRVPVLYIRKYPSPFMGPVDPSLRFLFSNFLSRSSRLHLLVACAQS